MRKVLRVFNNDIVRQAVSWGCVGWALYSLFYLVWLLNYLSFTADLPHNLSSIAEILVYGISICAVTIAATHRKMAGLVYLVAFIGERLCNLLYSVVKDDGLYDLFPLSFVAPILLIPGLFWLFTYFFGWRPLIPLNRLSLAGKIAIEGIWILSLSAYALGLTALWAVAPNGYGPDMEFPSCELVNRPYPSQAVFIARPIYVGLIQSKLLTSVPFQWALVAVENPYWGLPAGTKHVVLSSFGSDRLSKSETYLVRGDPEKHGIVPSMISIIRTDVNSRTDIIPVAEATRELESLNQPDLAYARMWGNFTVWKDHDHPNVPQSAKRITLRMQEDNRIVITDANGHFQFDGLPAGTYRIAPEGCKDHSCEWEYKVSAGDIYRCRFYEY